MMRRHYAQCCSSAAIIWTCNYLPLSAIICNYLQCNAICNAMQLFGPALPCGELRPDLAVHMHVQCILNQDDVDGGAWIFNMKTK